MRPIDPNEDRGAAIGRLSVMHGVALTFAALAGLINSLYELSGAVFAAAAVLIGWGLWRRRQS